MATPKVSVTVRLDVELLEKLDDFARRVGLSRTDVIERSIVAGLKEGESHLSKLENPIIRRVIEVAFSLDPTVTAKDKGELDKIIDTVNETRKVRRRKGSK